MIPSKDMALLASSTVRISTKANLFSWLMYTFTTASPVESGRGILMKGADYHRWQKLGMYTDGILLNLETARRILRKKYCKTPYKC